MTRIVRFHEFGTADVLRMEQVDLPAPVPGQVRIRVKALGLNRAEILMRSGTYIETPVLPSGLGLEAAGMVEQAGAGVTGFNAGDAVSLIPPVSMAQWPTYAEVLNYPAELVVRHPPSLSWEAAAATWMQYLTAYGGLIDIAGLAAGEPVVITAASSSVGLAAIQIANLAGAMPIAVTRHSDKAEALRQAGAHHVIASEEEDLAARLRGIAGAAGVRVVFDAVAGPLFEPLTEAMAVGGILIEYGGLSAQPTPFPLGSVLGKSLTLRGYLVHEILRDERRLRAAQRCILDGLAGGALAPVIARVFPFERIADAHRYLEANRHVGKVVVSVP
ncbi:zinc-dependent alcohol dehydrogenase family protein [Duganella hordei]|uniref:zinc-dependent alcohol dehydrogenase family protein n=1 Tax=Duganella hordei TaxID=2865934 RepID=UPI0030EAF9A5